MRSLLAVVFLWASPGLAQTTYLVPASYSTITLAEAARPASLTGTGVHDIVVSAGTYAEAVTISGSTGQSTIDYTRLRAASGAEHGGSFSSGVIIQNPGSSRPLEITERYTQIVGIVIRSVSPSTTWAVGGSAADLLFDRVLSKQENASYAFTWSTGTPSGHIYRSCVAWSTGAAGVVAGFYITGTTEAKYQNCTSIGFMYSFRDGEPTNCAGKMKSGGLADFFATAGGSNNASSDATAPGSGSLTGVSDFGFVDASTGNFHITTSSVLAGAGTNLSSTFTTDIDGETITTWMIGADFPYVAPASGGFGGRCCSRIRFLRR